MHRGALPPLTFSVKDDFPGSSASLLYTHNLAHPLTPTRSQVQRRLPTATALPLHITTLLLLHSTVATPLSYHSTALAARFSTKVLPPSKESFLRPTTRDHHPVASTTNTTVGQELEMAQLGINQLVGDE